MELNYAHFLFVLKTNRYVNLPSFTFYTLVSNAYETIPFKFHTLQFWNKRLFIDLKESTSQSDNSDPKYISLYQSKYNNFKPMFLDQKPKKFQLRHVECKCDPGDSCLVCNNVPKEIPRTDNNLECVFHNCLNVKEEFSGMF